MSAKVYDLFIEDAFTGQMVPNVGFEEEFIVSSNEGAEATFSTIREATAFYLVQDLNPTRMVKHHPATGPIERSA